MLLFDLQERAAAEKYSDPVLGFFAENIYPALAACSEPMPEVMAAFRFTCDELDKWFFTVKIYNPSWFEDGELSEEVIKFSDGKKIIIKSKRPSVVMQRVRLEDAASHEEPLDNIRRETFRFIYYPKLAGCSFGDVPDSEYARTQMSEAEIQSWYDAAKRQIPDWFIPLEQIAEQNQQDIKATKKKD